MAVRIHLHTEEIFLEVRSYHYHTVTISRKCLLLKATVFIILAVFRQRLRVAAYVLPVDVRRPRAAIDYVISAHASARGSKSE